MPKRKRKKKGHYHKGDYVSTKTGATCSYRSGWELLYLKHLDSNDDVISFEYEKLVIPYVSNKKTGKLRKYYPDFFVVKTDGNYLVEIKPSKRVHQAKVAKKLLAAGDWCRENNVTLLVITEKELKQLGLLK